MLKELKIEVCRPITMLIENKYAIDLAKNLVLHEISKHSEARSHFIKEHVNKKILKVIHCPTEEQLAALFTKVVKIDIYVNLRRMIEMVKL
jgi:hypothetical protein